MVCNTLVLQNVQYVIANYIITCHEACYDVWQQVLKRVKNELQRAPLCNALDQVSQRVATRFVSRRKAFATRCNA